jgi:hypothetical protein
MATTLGAELSLVALLERSYRAAFGRALVPVDGHLAARASWLYERALFGLLAHDAQPEPVFVYANLTAQRFGYDRHELIGRPSRLSAPS